MKKDYEPRVCVICGAEYIPRRSDQRTCGSDECKKARQQLNYREYRKTHYAALLETNRRSMAKKRKEREMEKHPPKPDTIVAIGYAERQMADSLRKAGKVRTEL